MNEISEVLGELRSSQRFIRKQPETARDPQKVAERSLFEGFRYQFQLTDGGVDISVRSPLNLEENERFDHASRQDRGRLKLPILERGFRSRDVLPESAAILIIIDKLQPRRNLSHGYFLAVKAQVVANGEDRIRPITVSRKIATVARAMRVP